MNTPSTLNHGKELSLRNAAMLGVISIFLIQVLLLLGYLMFKGGYLKRILGILLILAAVGYLADGAGRLLSPDYSITLSLYTFFGEVVLIFWLLIKGGRGKEFSSGVT
jgi:hypothetical protein